MKNNKYSSEPSLENTSSIVLNFFSDLGLFLLLDMCRSVFNGEFQNEACILNDLIVNSFINITIFVGLLVVYIWNADQLGKHACRENSCHTADVCHARPSWERVLSS